MRLLIAQQDKHLLAGLDRGFKDRGHLTECTPNGRDAAQLAEHQEFDAIIIQRTLEEHSGVEVCRALRRRGVGTPILMLSEDDSTETTVAALDSGADDFVTLPVQFDEIDARVRTLVRRCEAYHAASLEAGDLEMDVAGRHVFVGGQDVVLTQREFALLEYFMRNKDRVISRNAIGDRVWGDEFLIETSNVVDVYISRLRKKLPDGKMRIQTVHGMGYKLVGWTTPGGGSGLDS